MPRWFAHFLVIVGWLLTPIWAWAASHVGLWMGALVALRFNNPIAMLAVAGSGAFLLGFAVLWTWIRFVRHLPHLLSHHMAPRESVEAAAPPPPPPPAPALASVAPVAPVASRTSKEHPAIAAAD